MKQLAILFFILFTVSLYAQTFTPVKSTKSSVSYEQVTIVVEGKSFQAYKHPKTNSIHIKKTSKKSGKEYKSYLGYQTTYKTTVEGKEYKVKRLIKKGKGIMREI